MNETSARYQTLFRQVLAGMEPSASATARLRKLLPLIEERFANGATYRVVVEDLNAAGLPMSDGVFRVTLSRIRRHGRPATNKTSIQARTEMVVPRNDPLTQPLLYTGSKRIETPADLRAIRDMTIDLDALRAEGLTPARPDRTDTTKK
ncbi:hypothetical protein OURE66S_03594 [Oligella ureolytica]